MGLITEKEHSAYFRELSDRVTEMYHSDDMDRFGFIASAEEDYARMIDLAIEDIDKLSLNEDDQDVMFFYRPFTHIWKKSGGFEYGELSTPLILNAVIDFKLKHEQEGNKLEDVAEGRMIGLFQLIVCMDRYVKNGYPIDGPDYDPLKEYMKRHPAKK